MGQYFLLTYFRYFRIHRRINNLNFQIKITVVTLKKNDYFLSAKIKNKKATEIFFKLKLWPIRYVKRYLKFLKKGIFDWGSKSKLCLSVQRNRTFLPEY